MKVIMLDADMRGLMSCRVCKGNGGGSGPAGKAGG